MLTEGHGVPLSLCVTDANHHDSTQLEIVLDGIVVPRPEPDEDEPQNLCVDAAYVGEPARTDMEGHR